jgi:hypothetical protein
MLIPNKYEDINKNLLVVGSEVINKLNKKAYTIEDLFQLLKKEKGTNIEQYYNCLTFLWLADILTIDKYQISINKAK